MIETGNTDRIGAMTQPMRDCTDARGGIVVDDSHMPWNDDVTADVLEQLCWDPNLDAGAVSVSAEDGTVTLTGTVASERERNEATNIAAQTFGVVAVDNELRIR